MTRAEIIDRMTKGHVDAMLFAECCYDTEENPDDSSFSDNGFTFENLTQQARQAIRNDCERFFDMVENRLNTEIEIDYEKAWQLGADLYFDRQGHGTGAWDRDFYSRDLRKFLTDTADNKKYFATVYPYIDENNNVSLDFC